MKMQYEFELTYQDGFDPVAFTHHRATADAVAYVTRMFKPLCERFRWVMVHCPPYLDGAGGARLHCRFRVRFF
jgi:hypothetical protein